MIQVDYIDHQQTLSWSRSGPATRFRTEQRSVHQNSGLSAAMAMDALAIKAMFGSKYDTAMAEATAYATCLEMAA